MSWWSEANKSEAMRNKIVLLIASRSLKTRRESGNRNLLGSVLAIALSIIPLVVVLEVSSGMIEGITRRFIEIGTYHLQVTLYDDFSEEEWQSIAEKMEGLKGIRLAFLERQGLGLIYSREGRTGIQLRSVASSLFSRDPGLQRYFRMISGSFDLTDPANVLLGKVIAEKLGVDVGDDVKILTAKRVKTGRFLPRISRFKVAGVFSTGYQDIDKTWVYIPFETGLNILPEESSRQFIGIKVKDPYRPMEGSIQSIEEYLSEKTQMYRIVTWFDLEENQYRSFQTTKALLVFIMLLIVLVAAVNVSSSMVMIVMEKTQEIGILKSMGAGPSMVSLSFQLMGFLAGTLGSLLGIIVGLALAVNINELIQGVERLMNFFLNVFNLVSAGPSGNSPTLPITLLNPAFYLETIPIRIGLWELTMVAALVILLSTLAAYVPARRAGKIKPLEVLRRI